MGPSPSAWTLEGETIAEVAAAILAVAPLCFALTGISMGGFIELEIPAAGTRACLQTGAAQHCGRPDIPEQTAQRWTLLAKVDTGNFETLLALALPLPAHRGDPALREANVRMSLTVARGRPHAPPRNLRRSRPLAPRHSRSQLHPLRPQILGPSHPRLCHRLVCRHGRARQFPVRLSGRARQSR